MKIKITKWLLQISSLIEHLMDGMDDSAFKPLISQALESSSFRDKATQQQLGTYSSFICPPL